MKVQLLKDLLENKEGDIIECTEERGNYWLRLGVAILPKEKKAPAPKEKKELPEDNDTEKKEITKP